MESMERSRHCIRHHEQYLENLSFDKEGYFEVLIFYELFYRKEIENISPCVPHTLQKHSWKFGRTRNSIVFYVLANVH